MKTTKLLNILGVGLFGLISFGANAGSDNYPAAMCIKWNASLPTPTLNGSSILNPSTAALYVDCPAIRNDFDNIPWHYSAVESSWISAIDRNSADAVCSTLVKYRHTEFTSTATAASLGTQCTTITSGPSLYAQKLQQGSLSLGHPDYHLYFSVRIPGAVSGAQSSVVTYNVTQ